jgi:uncharacterized protein
MREGFYPQQVPIDAYGNGGFRFAGMSHKGGLLCLPSGIRAWQSPDAPESITPESLSDLLHSALDAHIILVGTGASSLFLPGLRQELARQNKVVETISTGAAIRTYNVLLAEQRAIACALYPVGQG